MTQNLLQESNYKDEIDLREILKIIIESKKLIVSTILIFTIASIIYSLSLKPSFESLAKLEIGYFEQDNGDRDLIESPSEIISDLNVFFIKNTDSKFNQDVSINSFEGKIINLETISKSAEKNENLITEIINYIYERHSNLAALRTNTKKNQISNKIDLIDSEISFLRENLRINLEAKILELQNNLPIIDQEISQLEQLIIQDTNNLNLLKGTTLAIERASNSPTLEQTISSYKSQINKLKRERSSSISDKSILSQKLDGLYKGDFQSDELFSLDQELKILENLLQTLMNEAQVTTNLIGNIETDEIKPKSLLMILLGIFIGLFTGILLTFIKSFIKNYRES